MVAKMEAKFLKYWTIIPYLYSFAFIFGQQMKMTDLFDILNLIWMRMGINYVETVSNDARRQFYDVYRAYEDEFQFGET